MRLRWLLFLITPLQFIASVECQDEKTLWVDSLMESMTEEEKIGQLFMIRAHSNLGQDHVKAVKSQIKKFHVGGLCFFQGTPEKQIELCNTYQSMSKLPMMVAMDAEWGPSMRLKSDLVQFPRQLMLGAIQDNSLIYRFGEEVGRQLRALGVHINFAPVLDVNINPNNPVINDRSFGEDKYNVTTKGYMYMRGMQEEKVMACAKHFPGHGDTDVDSHHDLPVLPFDRDRLNNIEMFPFQVLSSQGLQSIMIAHLSVPVLDNRQNTPASLSGPIISSVLKDEIGFNGIVFTDALEMQGVAKHHENGEVELQALKAGNDVLLLPNDIEKAFNRINEALQSGELSQNRLDRSVRKILGAKYDLGLTKVKGIDIVEATHVLQSNRAKALHRELIENSVTLIRNKRKLVPIIESENTIHTIALGGSPDNHFIKELGLSVPIQRKQYPLGLSETRCAALLEEIKEDETVVLSLHGMEKLARRQFGISDHLIQTIEEINKKANLVLVIFGNPYSLSLFQEIEHVIMAFENGRMVQEVTAHALTGVVGFRGRLPVTADSFSRFGAGISTAGGIRLGKALPERVGMSSDTLEKIDQIIGKILRSGSAPGCQVLVAKNNRIVFSKSYGYHTYDRKNPTLPFHIFDLASITKVASSTVAVMKLYEDNQLHLELPIVEYLPELKGSNKAFMNLLDIMAHHSGLLPWIPFYRNTLGNGPRFTPSDKYYRREADEQFSIPITDNLYLRNDYKDSLFAEIIDSDLRRDRNYRYSDLGFYLIGKIVERITGKSLEQYCKEEFYEPLRLQKTMFNPKTGIPTNEIVPSELDRYFRRERIQGYVHDMGAAMLGGVSGHAGLFSNSDDLVVLFQMLLNGGEYGGKQYLKAETISRFTQRHPLSSRRGIGFDMKELNQKEHKVNISKFASDKTFGHYGFTGTGIWVDPQHDLIYIFLSNRTFPSMTNNRLNREEYRIKIHDIIYRSFISANIS